MSTVKLTATQRSALEIIARHGGEVVCWPGGYWTYPNATTNDEGTPEWYAGTNTIRALSKRGMLALRTVPPRTFASNGTVTDIGHAALGAEPVVDECDECGGTGKCQQHCENCREPLTTANWKPEHECYACNKCVALDNAPHPNGGYAHYGCRCVGCAS